FQPQPTSAASACRGQRTATALATGLIGPRPVVLRTGPPSLGTHRCCLVAPFPRRLRTTPLLFARVLARQAANVPTPDPPHSASLLHCRKHEQKGLEQHPLPNSLGL